jgi:hypothetical protein
MMETSPFEKRREIRESYNEHGLLYLDGNPVMLLVRDIARRGVGAYTRTQLSRGERGKLSIKLPSDQRTGSYDSEVRWCGPCTDAEHKSYSFRVGLALQTRVLREKIPAPVSAPAPAPVPGPEETDEAYRVKGSMVIDFAKMIKANHDKPWQKYLDLDDMQTLNSMIIPLAWSPLKVFRKAGFAVFEVFGKKDPEAAREWGRNMVRKIPDEIYNSFFDKNDPARALRNYVNVNRSTFSFLRPRFSEAGPGAARIGLHGAPEVKKEFPELDLLGLILSGSVEELIIKNGGVNPQVSAKTDGQDDELIALHIAWK